MDKVNVLGVKIDKVTVEGAADRICEMLKTSRNHAVYTPNSEIIYLAYKDTDFCDLLNSADMLTADGIGVVYASKILKNPVPERAGGFDIACRVIEKIAETGYRLYLFGGKPGFRRCQGKRIATPTLRRWLAMTSEGEAGQCFLEM